jgi:hypothetical protein
MDIPASAASVQNVCRSAWTWASNLTENWNGYSGAFGGSSHGFTLSGNLVVNPSLVTVVIELPFIAFAYKAKVEAGVRDELTILLA